MNQELINMRKKYTKLMSECREAVKGDNCMYCNKPLTSFHHSHSVPQFILYNIAKEGKVAYYNTFMGIPITKEELGVREAGTFKLLCSDCDKNVFKDYEDSEKILTFPNNQILAQIALKNFLLYIHQRLIEEEMEKKMRGKGFLYQDYIEVSHNVKKLDLNDWQWSFKRAKKILDKNLKSGYKVLFWHKLDYVVPITFQKTVTLYGDLNGRIINDIYNFSSDIKMQDLHICIFPQAKETILLLFYHKDDRNYFNFDRQFNSLSLDEKLKLINYIIFRYTDAYFISPNVMNQLIENEILFRLNMKSDILRAHTMEDLQYFKKRNMSELKMYSNFDIPNLLNEKFSMR